MAVVCLTFATTAGCVAVDDAELEPDDVVVAEKAPPGLVNKVRQLAAESGIGPLPAAPAVRPELVELGRALAFDKLLSGPQNISCMTCHHPTLGTGDARHLSIGEGASGLGELRTHPAGVFIGRNAPPVYNLHALDTMFWDGRVRLRNGVLDTPAGAHITPEMQAVFEFGAASAQAMFPVTSPSEMRGAPGTNELADLPDDDFTAIWAGLMERLIRTPGYRELFEAAYPGTSMDDMTFAHASNAIAGFEIAVFEMRDSPWDRFLAGDDDALTQDQLKGAELFFDKGNCDACHRGAAFTSGNFTNIGVPQVGPGVGHGPDGADDWGRGGVTGLEADRYKFRIPPLRNVALTGPWGHAGQFTDLRRYIDHYDDPADSLDAYDATQLEPSLQGTVRDNFDEILTTLSGAIPQIRFNDNELDRLVDFLHALTDPRAIDQAEEVPESVPSGLVIPD